MNFKFLNSFFESFSNFWNFFGYRFQGMKKSFNQLQNIEKNYLINFKTFLYCLFKLYKSQGWKMWVLLCLFSVPLPQNYLGHWSHEKGFSPVWFLMCTTNSLLCLNALGHQSQGKGFLPEWIFQCNTSSLLVLKALEHWLQGKGFSPVWALLCTTRWWLCLKTFWHWWQGIGFSPVGVLQWTTSLPASLNVLGHKSHWNHPPIVWVILCTTSSLLVSLIHLVH